MSVEQDQIMVLGLLWVWYRENYGARKFLCVVQDQEWGIMVLDEVHTIPAKMFRRVLTQATWLFNQNGQDHKQ